MRHGESEKNKLDLVTSSVEGWPLTERGREQARKSAARLALLPRVDAFYTSPLLRAMQTAGIVAERIQLKPMPDIRLRERNFGLLEGKKEPEDPNWKFDKRYMQEPWESMLERTASFMESANGNTIIAVTHDFVISAACASVNGNDEITEINAYTDPGRFAVIDVGRKKVLGKNVSEIPDILG